MKIISITTLLLIISISVSAQDKRARELGIPLDGNPGNLNAITYV
jgi:hypothetical protein